MSLRARRLIVATANGSASRAPVVVEQCDDVNPSTAGWGPNDRCDPSTAGAAVFADGGHCVVPCDRREPPPQPVHG